MIRATTSCLSLSLAALSIAAPAVLIAAEPTLPEFDASDFVTPASNPYFPLETGIRLTYRGTRTDGEPVVEQSVLTVQGPGPTILGVPTITVLDEAFEDGLIVERTFDYYAADDEGNVWYFGEDVTNFRYDDEGHLLGTDDESAWRAGVNDALPGISVPANPEVGLTLFQEHAPEDEAMDYAEVLATDLDITGPAGTFSKVMKTFESSTVETDLREYKYYAPGFGMIRADEDMSEALDDPAVIVELQL